MKLMCVVAHPDDECFAFGGALALAAERGVETYVLCLTKGQAATNRGTASTAEELGAMRADEFRRSCAVLGVAHSEMLDQEDGRLKFADFSHVAGLLVERIRRFQPDVLLSFGLDGGLNTHADHMMAAMLTSAAFHWAGRANSFPQMATTFQPKRLFLLSTDRFLADRQAPLPAPWSVRLDIRSVLERKMSAFREHVSQSPLRERTHEFFQQHGGWEFYTLTASIEPQPVKTADDLFVGL